MTTNIEIARRAVERLRENARVALATSRKTKKYAVRLRCEARAGAYLTAVNLIQNMTMNKDPDEIHVRLKPHLDPDKPTLAAFVLARRESKVTKVVITGEHKVWTGAELGEGNFSIVKAS